MSVSKAHIQATGRYEAKTYDKILVRLRKDKEPTRETISAAAAKFDMSLNGYIIAAINEKIKNDGATKKAVIPPFPSDITASSIKGDES